VPGVQDVHDLHVWTLTSGLLAASGHLRLAEGAEAGAVLQQATDALNHDFEIGHVTLQTEPADYREPTAEV